MIVHKFLDKLGIAQLVRTKQGLMNLIEIVSKTLVRRLKFIIIKDFA